MAVTLIYHVQLHFDTWWCETGHGFEINLSYCPSGSRTVPGRTLYHGGLHQCKEFCELCRTLLFPHFSIINQSVLNLFIINAGTVFLSLLSRQVYCPPPRKKKRVQINGWMAATANDIKETHAHTYQSDLPSSLHVCKLLNGHELTVHQCNFHVAQTRKIKRLK